MELSIWQHLNRGLSPLELWIIYGHIYRTWFAILCILGMVFIVLRHAQDRPWRKVLMWLSTTLTALLFGAAIPLGLVAYLIAHSIANEFFGFDPPLYTVIILVFINAFVVALICIWALRLWGMGFTSRAYWWLFWLNAFATGLGLVMMIVEAIRNPPLAYMF